MEAYSGILSNVIEIVLGAWILKYLFTMTKQLSAMNVRLQDVTAETMRLRDKSHAQSNTIQDHELRIWKLESYNEQERKSNPAPKR